MDVTVHFPVLIQQFFFHGWESLNDCVEKFFCRNVMIHVKRDGLSTSNIAQGCKEIYFHQNCSFQSRKTSTFIFPLEMGEKILTTESGLRGASIPSFIKRGFRPSTYTGTSGRRSPRSSNKWNFASGNSLTTNVINLRKEST